MPRAGEGNGVGDPASANKASEPLLSKSSQSQLPGSANRQSWPFWLLVSVLACILVGTSAVLLRSSLLPLLYWEQSLLRPRLSRSQLTLLRSPLGQGSNKLLNATAAGGDLGEDPVDLTEVVKQPKPQQHRISAAVHAQSRSSPAGQQVEESRPPAMDTIAVLPGMPPAPPGPAESGYGTRPWPPGMNEKAVKRATEAMEKLMSQPNHTADPDQPWNRQPTSYTLYAIDQHTRFNPSYRAVTDLGDTVFVKFACFPGTRGHDAAGLCARAMPAGVEEMSRAHNDAIQAVTDQCGLSFLKSRTWSAHVNATTPEGIEINGLMGFFAEWVNGTNPEKWRSEGKIKWIQKLGPERIWLGALHDFILCESDRHQGNLVVLDGGTGAFKFIDNDHELNNRAAIGQGFKHVKDKSCMPSSLFLPQNMESWRLLKLKVPLAKLDMRCWTGPTMDIPLPSKVRTCLEHFSGSTPQQLQEQYGMPLLEHAESLHQRSKDLLELGFWRALMRQVEPHESTFWWNPARLPWDDHMFAHWRHSLWRPLEEPNCRLD
ncbi:hypothetical protein WJX73_006895 [Symbiochloris irregularis]|uniref:PI3K/PI4K catalytic domain-containing protein n=1 Tax=Symbiochloris irregularis TaxID=706552 RepID=A0AAW1PLD3_9CHLO